MHTAAFLALLAIALLALAALRLELNFRRAGKEDRRPEPAPPGQKRRPAAPELRASPAGGYWQAPFPRVPQARRAGFAL